MAHPLPEDKRAGYIGLVAGLVSIIITVVAIVELTNRAFESHAAAPHGPPPPGATQPGPPPPRAPAPAPH
jgi:hypothetical protein